MPGEDPAGGRKKDGSPKVKPKVDPNPDKATPSGANTPTAADIAADQFAFTQHQYEAQLAMQEALQQMLRDNIGAVNTAFEGREPLYQRFGDATRKVNQIELDRQHGDASRNLNFALQRSGHAGGRVQVDQGAELARSRDRGILRTNQAGESAENDFRSDDNSLRANLTNLAASGTISGSQLQSVIDNGMRGVQNSAGSPQVSANYADLFAGVGQNIGNFAYNYGQANPGNQQSRTGVTQRTGSRFQGVNS